VYAALQARVKMKALKEIALLKVPSLIPERPAP